MNLIERAVEFFEKLGYKAHHLTGSLIYVDYEGEPLICAVMTGADVSSDPTELAMRTRESLKVCFKGYKGEQDKELNFALLNLQKVEEGKAEDDEWLVSYLYLGTETDAPKFGINPPL